MTTVTGTVSREAYLGLGRSLPRQGISLISECKNQDRRALSTKQ